MDRIRQGSQRTEELNERISTRNNPSAPLQPQFDIRPLSTKYSMMPIFDRRPIPTVSINVLPSYDITTTFNPGNVQAAAPWAGFANNVNEESRLRNQFFAIQRGAVQSTYIPFGQMHRLSNPGTDALEIIEVQSGSYLGEDDIERFEDSYGRN